MARYHLFLMRRMQTQRARFNPAAFRPAVNPSQNPTTGIALDLALQSPRNRLIAKAFAEQRHACSNNLTDQRDQPRHPGVGVVHRGRAAGDHHAVDPVQRGRKLARCHLISRRLPIRARRSQRV